MNYGRTARGCLGVVVLVIAFIVSYLTYHALGWNLLVSNDTTRYLYQYREIERPQEISLVPDLLQVGTLRSDVQELLVGAGLDTWSGDSRYGPPGSVRVDYFSISAGMRSLPCGNLLLLEIGYDGADRLVSATVSQGGACL